MKYSETGQFTLEMKRLAKQISKSISKLRSLGCVVLGKECFLTAYMAEDYRHSHEHSSDYELKSLEEAIAAITNTNAHSKVLYMEEIYLK